jgi:deazaflavin-dependent oxidoreductase (nitroreductase family)
MNDFNERIINDFRANEGRVGPPFEGAPMVLLHTTGAKSGAERVSPLVYNDIDGKRYITASKAGADTHPAWYHNILANPSVTLEIGTETYAATATPVDRAERDRLWKVVVERMPGFADYEKKTDRIIPLVELTRD